jgi:hypothetical protein
MNSEFEKGCELDNCEWCNFQKHYNAGNLSYNEMSLTEKFQEIDER